MSIVQAELAPGPYSLVFTTSTVSICLVVNG